MLFEDLRASVLALIDNIKKNMGYRQLDGLALYRSHVIHAKSFKKLLITLDNLQEYETIEDYLSVSQYEHVKQELKRYQQTTQEEIENEEKFSSLRSIISKFLIRKRRYLGRYFAHPMMQNRRAKRDDYKPSAVRVTQRYVP
ncbi:hypothetical protein Psal025_02116 [Piscirickettsia salmonis]|nr:hypothetical protein [Piscirickettsia salmonis]QGN77865.1 hypothetical protein Psal001_02084 [Piscirickettsia salmonis]QGN84275.1 hypothetical protein Psal003_01325 [Piscirickettsia salmonis]QGN87785.1 hypothetical protein Psal004_01321 [Piscirickettsia salmonis]QGN92086.1 hypothetical protein Psal005_02133 [Piscirickettsia salmonis]QGO09149.1 hypothetical protein Psal010a_01327 [Piscirickettsia salmonis]